jgi:hypothetical protein
MHLKIQFKTSKKKLLHVSAPVCHQQGVKIEYNLVVLKVSRSRYKYVAVYILYGVCIQTSVSILCDLKRCSVERVKCVVSGGVV